MPPRKTDVLTWPQIVNETAEKVRALGIVKGFKEWMLQQEKVGYCFDYYMWGQCYNMWRSIQNDQDYFVVIVGKEGSGKSTFSAQISTVIDPTFNLDRMHFDSKPFFQHLRKGKHKTAQVIDEGGLMLFGRQGMSFTNVALNKVFMVMRSKNTLTVINIPDYKKLDPGVRHRVDLLIRTDNSRGSFVYKAFVGKAIAIINNNLPKVTDINQVKTPNGFFWQGYFNRQLPPNISKKDYLNKKDSNINKLLDRLIKGDGVLEEHKIIPIWKVKKLFNVSRSKIDEMANKGTLKPIKIDNNIFFKLEDIKNVLEGKT